MSQRAPLSRAKEPDWCVAASGVGTYRSRVLMPRATYGEERREAVILKVTVYTCTLFLRHHKRKYPMSEASIHKIKKSRM